ncbi:MAG: molybdate ABC transporter substrate-binding protein, partial [Actinomycetota bacterium]|nr:molybdate ABC transporter substrate-binding protein [Actinomycetota bacterium]
MRWLLSSIVIAGWLLAACGSSSPQPSSGRTKSADVTVFAASSLTQAFTKLGAVFERQHSGTQARFNFSASDTLATQITQGAPADVFAAAGVAPMTTVTSSQLATGPPQEFATNRLVIITPRSNPAGIKTPRDLARPGVKLVLAAPGVPAGDYARQMFDNLGIRQAAERNVVSNEVDDKSVVSKVLLGDADAGIVYVTDLTPDVRPRLTAVRIPRSDNIVARYPIAMLKNGSNSAGGRLFMQLVLSPAGKK